MRIFVTGASGYIGAAVAAALARAGHEVLGLVRSESRGREGAGQEVRPVVGSLEEPRAWIESARESEVLIHCAAEFSPRMAELDARAIDALLEAARSASRARLIVYTSGCWIYGDTGGVAVNEASPLNPFAMVRWRVGHEEKILDADGGPLRTLILRPGCVYGGRGGLTASWFESASRDGAARVIGGGRARWTMVHIADLAHAYLLAAESPWRRDVFNASDRSRFTTGECAEAASRAAGAGGRVTTTAVNDAANELGPMAEALAADQHVDASKAVRMLGWQPRHGGFVDGAERYYLAWKAGTERK